MVAAILAQTGAKIIPVHGMRRTKNGWECDCLSGARWFAERNGTPVQPCLMPAKKPRLTDWPNLATTDVRQIFEWASDQHGGKSTTNFSAVTGGGSGVWVLDIDGALGFESLDAVQAEIGVLPKTWASISGSGQGAHLWWRLPSGVVVRNSANQLAPKIDVRGENGQIVLPGSRHKSGNRYMWAEGCAPDETELVEAPPALLKMALDACKKTREQQPANTASRSARAQRQACSRPQSYRPGSGKRAIIGDGPGGGGFHGPINSLACSYFRQLGPDADHDKLKVVLTEFIGKAPTGSHREPGYVARYLDPAYLDAAIESARAFILEKN
jgi:hypothetical protein